MAAQPPHYPARSDRRHRYRHPLRGTAADLLDELAAELGFTWSAVLVTTPEAAQAVGFPGSPSIHIDGVDPFADPATPVGLSCRINRTPAGLTGSPDRSQLRDALIQAGTSGR